jgi:hypothetical protein
MADYSFSGLSTRSFEQLIQALCMKLLGPNTVIFGDGPDGGREATYEGPSSYGTDAAPWNGYIVVQAKFRQKSESMARDAAWALSQLASEVRKFQNRKRKLRRPDYYIFATNVALTPVYKKGSKDKAYVRLNKLKDSLRLKGFDVWDYDKLRTFLDGYEDIRRAYGAWVTPGDVLAELVSGLNLKHAQFDDILTNFLQKELLSDRYANLEQAGHTVEERVPLANVFVDLPTLREPTSEPPDNRRHPPLGFVREILETARERFDNESLSSFVAGRGRLSREGARLGRYVLVGGPGQGKTTVGQFICQLFRTSILRHKPRKMLSGDALEAMREIEDQCESEGLSIPTVRRFPIRVVLSEYATHLNQRNDNLLTYLAGRIQAKSGKQFTIDDFRRWLGSYPFVLILDGLDEVPASSNREQLLNTVRDFWIDVADCAADILVLATTRPQGYNDDFSPKFYEHKYLTPLTNEQALHYAKRLVHVRYEGEETRIEKILDRLERACRQSSPTSRLMRSPLQVTIMTTLVDRVGQPPQERWNLFKDYYTVIYEREIERDSSAASLLRDYQADINAIHARVGLLLQVESEKTGRTDARLSLERFKAIVRIRLSEEGHEGKNLRNLEDRLITAAMHRLVFLVGLEQGQIGFEVRSLQEFMAAEGLIQGSEADLAPRLRAIAPISHWRNVFLFAAGWCFSERQILRDTIQAICCELNEDSDDAVKAVLAGSQLAVDLLEDGSARRQPKQASALFRIAFRLLDLPPTDYQTKLGSLYSPEFEKMFEEEISKRLYLKSYEAQLGAWNALSVMNPKISFVKRFRNEHWPQDKHHSLSHIKYLSTPQEIYDKLLSLAPVFTPHEIAEAYSQRLFRVGFSRSVVKGSPTSWFGAFMKLLNQMLWERPPFDVVLRVPANQAEQTFRTSISCFTDGQLAWQIPFSEMPASPLWQPFIAAGCFLRNPSHAELGAQLAKLANCDLSIYQSPKLPWFDWLSSLPWPLGASLSRCSNGQLLALSSLARDGSLGGFSDWRNAEQRWLSKGISLEDIQYIPSEPSAFDKAVGTIGFPFGSKQSFGVGQQSGTSNPLVVLDTFNQLSNTHISNSLASAILWILEGHSDYHRKPDYSAFQALLPFLQPDHLINLDSLALMFPKDIDDHAIGELDRIGREAIWLHSSGPIPESFVNKVWKGFIADPTRLGLLRLLAECAGPNVIPEIPFEYIDPLLIDDLRLRRAAVTVLLAQNCQGKLSLLAVIAAGLGSQLSEFLSDAVAIIREQRIDSKSAEAFLLSVLANVPQPEKPNAARSYFGLNELVKSRKSHLDDRALWQTLHLPAMR